jgi:DNA-binding NarL/FixJ family response regulator
MTGTTALLVDDHPVFRSGLAVLLNSAGLQVVAETSTGADAAELARQHRPDVVVMDLGLPDLHGVRATEQVLQACPTTAVLIVTMYDDDTAVARALAAGARGYVLKDAPPAEVVKAVALVAAGAGVMGSGVADRMTHMMASGHAHAATPPPAQFPNLTDRERQVLGLMGKGLTNAAIAERLGISGKTVANYISNILVRLNQPDREAAIQLAQRKLDE